MMNTPGWVRFLKAVFIPVFILMMIGSVAGPWLSKFETNRLEKPEYHWTQMMGDSWIYSPTDVDIWSPSVKTAPVGAIAKTSEGAWTAKWPLEKTCGEFLSRELAERCVEKAADDAGFFGYVFVPKKPAPDPVNTSVSPPAPAANSNRSAGISDPVPPGCFVSLYGLLNCSKRALSKRGGETVSGVSPMPPSLNRPSQ